MFTEPVSRDSNLLPLVVRVINEIVQHKEHRRKGFSTDAQITMCVSGEGVFYDVNNVEHHIGPGDFFYFTPGSPHSYVPVKEPWIVKYIVFSGSETENIFYRFGLYKGGSVSFSDKADAAYAAELVDKIFVCCNSMAKSRLLPASSYLYELLFVLAENFSRGIKTSVQKNQRLDSVITYISENFSNPNLSFDMVCEYSQLSHTHLCRLFKSVYHMSPHDYLNLVRIEKAKTYLSGNRKLKIKEIADKCGFNSSSYFTAVFKRLTGMTPDTFRSENTYSN